MSKTERIWQKQAAWPSIIALFSIAFLAQVPHFYYLSDIVNFNNTEQLTLLIAFPIFGALGLSAVGLLISEFLYKRDRAKDKPLFRYLIQGAFIAVLIYFAVQFLIVFFGFEAIEVIRDGMPLDIVDNVAFKEILGMSIILIIGVFINPPLQDQTKRKKK
ncbi:MAG: hypothetical protein ACTSVO_10525 [Candidatus Heimdallarchaeaceae archaeon]